MTTIGFDPFVTPVDYFLLGGLKSPGHARITGAGSRRKVDVRGAYGMSASIAVWLEVAEFKAEIDLFTAEDWQDWWTWKKAALREVRANQPQNNANGGVDALATDISHPLLAPFDIKAVIVKSVSQPEEVDPTGVYRVTIEFIEYRKVKLTLSKPKAARQRPPEHWADRYMRDNTDTIERLNQELAK